MSRKTVVLVVAVLELLVLGGVVGMRVADWHVRGWSGLTFHPHREIEADGLDPVFFGEPGRVFVIAPGSPVDRAGIGPEDRITAVGGIPIAEVDRLRALADKLRVGDELTYDVERGDAERSIEVTVETPFATVLQTSVLISNVVASLTWLGISLLVYWARPGSRVAGVFFAMCASGAAVYLFWAGGELDYPGLRGILPFGSDPGVFIFIGLTAMASVVFTNLVLHLTLVFPKPRPVVEEWPRVLVWIHTAPFLSLTTFASAAAFLFVSRETVFLVVGEVVVLAVGGVLVWSLYRSASERGVRRAVLDSPWRVTALLHLAATQLVVPARIIPKEMFALFFGVSALASVAAVFLVLSVWALLAAISLYRTHRESGLELRQQIRWPLWGTFTALVSSLVLSVLSVIYGVLNTEVAGQIYVVQVATGLASKLAYLLIPVSFAAAILKYRLLDIDVIIKKTVVYAAATGIVIALYLGVAGLSGLALVQSIGIESQVSTVVATLAVVALFVPVRNRVQRFVERRFFQHEWDLSDARERITRAVLHGESPSIILPQITEGVQRALRVGAVAILTRRPGADLLVGETTLGLGDRALEGVTIHRGSAELQGSGVLDVADAGEAVRVVMKAARAHTAVVASRDGRAVGLLLVGRPQGRADFTDDEREFLEDAADQIAVAVGRRMQQQAEGELEKARSIQKSLLPQRLPDVDGLDVAARWEPAREVSGDYYDVIRLDESRLMVCIGDVVGKGLPAALLMSTLQAAVKAVAASTDDPAKLCEQVRSVVRGSLSGGRFVTFFCAVVDRARLVIISCNAGHNPPILARASGEVTRLEVGGPAMARMLGGGYETQRSSLAAGDRLVLFTDGATEAMDSDGELFGDDRLEALAVELAGGAVDDVERALAATVVAHARGVLQDDLTLVVVGVE